MLARMLCVCQPVCTFCTHASPLFGVRGVATTCSTVDASGTVAMRLSCVSFSVVEIDTPTPAMAVGTPAHSAPVVLYDGVCLATQMQLVCQTRWLLLPPWWSCVAMGTKQCLLR